MTSYASKLDRARQLASKAKFPEFLSLCKEIQQNAPASDTLLSLSALLQTYGYITFAKQCLDSIVEANPRALVNLANIEREAGNHRDSRRIYQNLLSRFPDSPIIRRNYLTSLEYDPGISDEKRYKQAVQWGRWIDKNMPRPAPTGNKVLRIGYVSADLCQHTVGLFVKDVIKRHTLSVYIYSAARVKDWVTKEVQRHSEFKDVNNLGDNALAELIRKDKIDILVDLSGHTAGSRLTVFALRPARVQVSWLGYFATTGLKAMDAVLLDNRHAPPGTEKYFVEEIVRLPSRFCYTPVPFAPAVSDPPCLKNGYITFGSFNNTAKYSRDVYKLYNRVLEAVPGSKLILKWRTFQDEDMCRRVSQYFSDPGRVEFRGASFHKHMLAQYADIDIALDPFPFTGGLTSCEALWMGVPVITMPQSRVVSRQTYSFLGIVGLEEFAAEDKDAYVRIAKELATDKNKLVDLRHTMRRKMRGSVLMDIDRSISNLEMTMTELQKKYGPA